MKYIMKILLILSLSICFTGLPVFATEIVGFDEYGYLDQYGNYIDDESLYDTETDYEQYQASSETDFSSQYLSGDTKLACEAILCLSSYNRPSECSESINRYYSIKRKKWSNTVKARLNFLKKCPLASEDPAVASLLETLSQVGGMCDAEGLNDNGTWVTQTTDVGTCYGKKNVQGIAEGTGKSYSITYTEDKDGNCTKTVKYWKVNTTIPSDCAALWNHAYTYFPDQPKLVYGVNPWDTHWVE